MGENVDYSAWVQYLEELWEYCGAKRRVGTRMLDVACGTGNVTLPLAARGYRLTGVDRSPAMLGLAQEKALHAGLDVRWVRQDMRRLRLPAQTFQMALSACDGLNYLLSPAHLTRCFVGVARALQPGGLFTFDLNTRYKLAHIYGNSTYTGVYPDFAYVWKNRYHPGTRVCRMRLTFLISRGTRGFGAMWPSAGGRWQRTPDSRERSFPAGQRVTEVHLQRAHKMGEVQDALQAAGFTMLGAYAFPTFQPVEATTERVQVVARRE